MKSLKTAKQSQEDNLESEDIWTMEEEMLFKDDISCCSSEELFNIMKETPPKKDVLEIEANEDMYDAEDLNAKLFQVPPYRKPQSLINNNHTGENMLNKSTRCTRQLFSRQNARIDYWIKFAIFASILIAFALIVYFMF